MIFFLDEAGFQSDPPLARTYGLKGHTPVVTSSGQRQSINVIVSGRIKLTHLGSLQTDPPLAAVF
jgi:hypothetical protein